MNAKGYFVDAGQNSRKTGINLLREYREAYRVVLARGQGDGLIKSPAAPVSHIGLPGFVARAAIFNGFLIGVTRKAEDAQTNLDGFEGFFLHLAGEQAQMSSIIAQGRQFPEIGNLPPSQQIVSDVSSTVSGPPPGT